MTSKRIYLDVDGALSPFDPVQHQPGWQYRTVRAAGMHVEYSPNLVSALRNLPAEIVWLTSWEDDAAISLAPMIGLPNYRVLHPSGGHEGSEVEEHWWKLNALQNDDPTEFYWFDDELDTNFSAQHWTTRRGGHWISPNRFTGITAAHLQQLTDWLAR